MTQKSPRQIAEDKELLDLRDQFAMAALPAMISAYAASNPLYGDTTPLQYIPIAHQIIVQDAYDLADEMMEERKKFILAEKAWEETK